MKKTIHPAGERGHFDFGWLNTHHSFSFGGYMDPEKVHFGALRVLNDDIVLPSKGFGKHPHENMEIISIPLSGKLMHSDSSGHSQEIGVNEVQVMSAGTGIFHSEYNPSDTEKTNFLQIWIFPDKGGHSPRYDQDKFDPQGMKNRFQQLVHPKEKGDGLWINQQAFISRGYFEKGTFTYQLHIEGNGVYFLSLEGEANVGGALLKEKDAVGIEKAGEVEITVSEKACLLAIEVPMDF